jgi:hypothetical protein
MKQTAVEWLLNELDYETICKFDKQLVQAKEMEKKQIVNAVNLPREKRWYNALLYNNSGEQYYNEQYESKI